MTAQKMKMNASVNKKMMVPKMEKDGGGNDKTMAPKMEMNDGLPVVPWWGRPMVVVLPMPHAQCLAEVVGNGEAMGDPSKV